MKPDEIVEQIKKNKPALFEKVPEKQAVVLIRLALAQIGKQIEATNEGVVKVPGFGNFRVRVVETEKDGEKVAVKRVLFNTAKAGAGKKEQASK
ncbi:MAG: hypothetical protein KJ850_03020 [Gammaproteobacteria bacterium]|nr:hypothetical protein [Gammaproteobacteria bacterium]MBU1623997.1 hypothetical protein [Gammaproteobacteria bacterium]MBU1981725.1 hypothetical protein [Gammaproteobacteria bacterium]